MNDSLQKALAYIAARFKEPSTYVSVALILTAFGRLISPEQQNAIMIIGLFLAGLIGAVLPDRLKQNTRASDAPVLPPEKKEPQ